jgi:hypothetical protein
MGVKKDIARYVGIIGLLLGVIVAAIGSLWNSSRNESSLFYEPGPYAMTVGIGGFLIFMAGLFILTLRPKQKR